MRLWLNRTGEVSLREQLITQVVLAILCKELLPGERLPSTRDLARRFGIHANTASAAYRELEREGWLEFRHGSGVYVRATRPSAPLSPGAGRRSADWRVVAKARKMGAADSLVRARLRRWLQNQPPVALAGDRAGPGVARHRDARDGAGAGFPVAGCAPEECAEPGILEGSMPVVLPSKAAAVRKLLPRGSGADRAPGASRVARACSRTCSAICPITRAN